LGKIILRECEPKDVASLAVLLSQLGYPTSPEAMSERMARINQRDDYATFIAEEAGKAVGMAGAALIPGYVRDAPNGQIMALVVAPDSRRRGIGATLVAQVEAWLAAKGAARIVVTSGRHRPEAHAFYTRLGFEETGCRFFKEAGEAKNSAT
jgi:GNAT superfamily N-acetyltransferase